jgi:hypothetical protein
VLHLPGSIGMKVGLMSGTALAVLSTLIGQAAAEIVVIVGALTALGWLWSKMILPAAKAARRVLAAVGVFEDLGEFMDDTRGSVKTAEQAARAAAEKAEALDRRLDLLERHVGVYAAEDAARIRQAMQTGTIERRQSPGP